VLMFAVSLLDFTDPCQKSGFRQDAGISRTHRMYSLTI
jgi:hypothetical protein